MKKAITIFSITALIMGAFGHASACGHNGKGSQASTTSSTCGETCKVVKAETANAAPEKSQAQARTADAKIVDDGTVAQKATCPYLSSMDNCKDANSAGLSGYNCRVGDIKSLQNNVLPKKSVDKSKIASRSNAPEEKTIAQEMAN